MYNTPFHASPLNDKTFLITGGAGFIGSHIVAYLLKYGAKKVRVLDDLSTGFRSNIELFLGNDSFEFIHGDIRDKDTCIAACKDIQLVSHQAAIGSVPRSVKDPITTNDVNIGGFVNLVAAAKEAACERIVYASSSSVYGDDDSTVKSEDVTGQPLSPYAVSKKSMELYADVFSKVYELPFVGLRYFNVFGPRQDPHGAYAAVIPLFIKAFEQNHAVSIHDDGLQTRDFTFVENAVQANILALLTTNSKALNNVFNIGVGGSYSIIQLYESLVEITGKTPGKKFTARREGDVRHSCAGIQRATELLGYSPAVDFEEGLKFTVSQFK